MLVERTQEEEMLRRSARELATSLDAGQTEQGSAWAAFAEMGMSAISAPVEVGGVGMKESDLGVVIQAVAEVRPDWAGMLAMHNLSAACRVNFADPAADYSALAPIIAGAYLGTTTAPFGPPSGKLVTYGVDIPCVYSTVVGGELQIRALGTESEKQVALSLRLDGMVHQAEPPGDKIVFRQ